MDLAPSDGIVRERPCLQEGSCRRGISLPGSHRYLPDEDTSEAGGVGATTHCANPEADRGAFVRSWSPGDRLITRQ